MQQIVDFILELDKLKGDAEMVVKLKKLGIVPGKYFDTAKLDPAVARGVERVPKAGLEKIMGQRKEAGRVVNGWPSRSRPVSRQRDAAQR